MTMREHTYEGDLPYIFISYAHDDQAAVTYLTRGLDRQGFRLWFDAGIQHGIQWQEYIARKIAGCACMILFLSPAAAASRHCKSEIAYAFSLDKPMLVVYLEDTQLSPGLQMQLSFIQAMFRKHYDNASLLLDALCAEPMLQPCLDTKADAMEKEASMQDSFILALGHAISAQDSKPAIVDLHRIAQFQEAYHILEALAAHSGACLTYELNTPYKSMGSISLRSADLIFDAPAALAKAAGLASVVEVYPRTDDTIEMVFSFHGLTRPISD